MILDFWLRVFYNIRKVKMFLASNKNKNMKKITLRKGFTLIELLIVIAIIGLLAVFLLPSVLDAPRSARDAGRKVAVNDLVIAVEQYKAANLEVPSTGGCLIGNTELASYLDIAGAAIAAGDLNDPEPMTNSATNCEAAYYYDSTNNRYAICLGLETEGTSELFFDADDDYDAIPSASPTPATNTYCIDRAA